MKINDLDIQEETISSQVKERRYIYNGEASTSRREDVPRGNRPISRRKRSPFNIIIIMIAVSLMIVSYVWNKITVNRLAVEISELQTQYQRIQSANEVLLVEVNRKSSLERIGKIATEKLGMVYAKVQPTILDLDEHQLEQVSGGPK
jgi:cell division protein FtsL